MEFLDDLSMKSLDFTYILNRISPLSPYGLLYKKRLRPYKIGEEKDLVEELNKLESFMNQEKYKEAIREINSSLYHIKDLRGSITRAREGFILTEVELFEIKNFLYLIRDLEKTIEKHGLPTYPDMEIKRIEDLERLLDPEDTKISSFYIYDSYSDELKALRNKKRDLEKQVKLEKKHLKGRIQEDLGLKLRPDSSLLISKDEKDLIEGLKSYPYLTYQSETYMTIKYGINKNQDLKDLESHIGILKDKEEREEEKIREKLSKEIGKKTRPLFRNIGSIGKLDLVLAKVKFAQDIGAIKPTILLSEEENPGLRIEITGGIHPLVEDYLRGKDLKFTPISISLKEGTTCITGANMGGKTISLKLVGLLAAMAQYGLFVPAERMEYKLVNFIKTSIGDMQSTDSGLSTFGGEIKTLSGAIENADKKGLILIDELARGTNPEEGYAISKAIVHYLKDKSSISLLTTHYDNIGNLENVVHFQVIGLSKINIKDLDQGPDLELINKYMDYRLQKVEKDTPIPRDAINIAKLMGLKAEIIERAEGFLKPVNSEQ